MRLAWSQSGSQSWSRSKRARGWCLSVRPRGGKGGEGSEWTADFRFCAGVYNYPTKSVSLSVEKIVKMRDFAAIDFETANSQRTSVCSVGVVVVRDGVIADSIYRLIRPRPNFYSRFTTAIHGLTREDTDSAPAFDEVWREIAPRIEGFRSWPTIRPSTKGVCGPPSTSTACPIPVIRSTARAGLHGRSSDGNSPTISCIPSPRPAATTCRTTTMPWPTPRPVPASPSGSYNPSSSWKRSSQPSRNAPPTAFANRS